MMSNGCDCGATDCPRCFPCSYDCSDTVACVLCGEEFVQDDEDDKVCLECWESQNE